MELAAALEPLAFLLGTWWGTGRGAYSTIEPFEYAEEIVFSHIGKPFLVYEQKTWDVDGHPLHTESGYLRPVGGHGAELIIAQPTGITEIHSGRLDGHTLRLTAQSVGVSPTAKVVRAVARTISVDDDTLTYRLDMEAVGQAMQFHLEAELTRSPAGS